MLAIAMCLIIDQHYLIDQIQNSSNRSFLRSCLMEMFIKMIMILLRIMEIIKIVRIKMGTNILMEEHQSINNVSLNK